MKVSKAYEITDAKIQFVSLVDKAANLKSFLITKAADGKASFSTYGRIIQKDAEHHFVTGIVYEPMAEDAHGNYMTEEEITKSAYYFAKAGGKVDLQHSFEPLPGAAVVESWIAKADFDVEGETVKKGTWLMTVELSDSSLWDAIEKGDITGFSMGGVGNYSEEDVDLADVEKNATGGEQPEQQSERKGLFKKLAEALGFEVVEKGVLADKFDRKKRAQDFFTAFYALEDILTHWDSWTGENVLETDEEKVKEALADFTAIVEAIVSSGEPVTKQLAAAGAPVVKAGRKMSAANRETLAGIHEALGTFLAAFDPPEDKDVGDGENGSPASAEGAGDGKTAKPAKNKTGSGEEDPEDNDEQEDKDVKKSEVEKLVQEAVSASVAKALGVEQPAASGEVTAEAVQKMVEEAVNKALGPQAGAQQQEEPMTPETVAKMVQEAVSKAVEPVLKARGIPSALNDSPAPVEKQAEPHYLHGIL